MKTIAQIILWIGCIILGYFIYNSITGPIQFKKVKEERYAQVVTKLKDIKRSQEAFKTVKGKYASDFKTLIGFIEKGEYIITQQRDSSFMQFDETYKIDVLKEVKIIDTLGTVSVKDSLFKADNRYKTLMDVPGIKGKQFKMSADVVNKGGYNAPVFEAKVDKKIVLFDQPKDLLAKEVSEISVEEVNGPSISVGSLYEVSTSGNWPSIYDKKAKK